MSKRALSVAEVANQVCRQGSNVMVYSRWMASSTGSTLVSPPGRLQSQLISTDW